MSFADEEPRIEPDWNEFEESTMRGELKALRDQYAYGFITIQAGDGDTTPSEILLGGVLQSESSGPVDIWVSIKRIAQQATTTIKTAGGGYVISDHEVVSSSYPSIPLDRADMKHIRFWLHDDVVLWGKDHSLRIAEKLHRQAKSLKPMKKLISKLFGET
jgi:hypothetical protein